MKPLASAAIASTTLLAGAVAIAFLVGDARDSEAELDANTNVFTSRIGQVRMIVPRAWRASDLPSYPGVVLWMAPRTGEGGQIALTSEPFTRELYCSWPVACRTLREPLPSRYYCAVKAKLEAEGIHVGVAGTGPKENEANGFQSIWFDYEDGKHFLRHAIAMSNDRAVSLVLSAPTGDARASLGRPFDQALRTLRILTAEESAAATAVNDAGVAPDAPNHALGAPAATAPIPVPTRLSPVGPCN